MNRLMKSLVGFASAILVSIGASVAETGDWQVVETSGIVRTSQTMAGIQPVSTGNMLGAGSVLSTGVDGHAVLVRGEQQIVVGPNSRMSLPATQESGMTKIVQDLGTLLFKVDKKEKQHFQVETPIIAAVVKGTTFTVTAGVSGHSVHVAEGAVEVSAVQGRANRMVTAGMTATISKSNPSAIVMTSGAVKSDSAEPAVRNQNTKEASNLAVPTDVGVDQLDYATLSNGVIQNRQTTPAGTSANAAMGNDVSSAVRGQGGGAAVVEQIRMTAVGDSGKSNRGVGNAFGVANGNNGVGVGVNAGNGNGNNGNGNGNGGASVGVNAGNGNGNNGNGNGNGGASVGVNVGNGNGNNGNGNGNGGVDIGVDVGGIEVEVGLEQSGVGAGLGLPTN